MTKIDLLENSAIKNMRESMKVMADAFAHYPALDDAVRQANLLAIGSAIQSAVGIVNQFNNIFSGNEQIMRSFLDAFSFQTEFLRNTKHFYLTDAISAFRDNLLQNNYFSAIEAITSSLQRSIIEVPNIALLRLNKPLVDVIGADLPRGLRTSLDDLHIRTARGLSTSESISYNSEQATFFVEASPDDSCKAKELNVIYSGARLLAGITEEELMEFLRHLSTYVSLGSVHYVGEKIMKIVKSIEWVISFDADYYYHARTLDDESCPYTDEDMTCAPHGITSFGRFNHIGDNYYYFSDQQTGAVEEVRKHSPQKKVQVAKLKPKGKVRMVDISQEKESVFLKYCRFPFNPQSNKKVPREYLIPSFFSDCCKLQGFDGIKYYGTKAYRNYVTWKDGHFDIVNQEVMQSKDIGKAGIM